jgi:DMSO/TMAO reductase YedYZ molybdopterin-dependent catalytic subunit
MGKDKVKNRMKRMRASRSNIYWIVTFMLISMFMFITQACSSPSTSTSTTTATTAQASTQTLTTSSAVTTQSTSTKTTTSITQSVSTTTSTGTSTPISTTTGQVEATEFQGTKLTPIKDQLLNAIQGTQNINQANYTLTIDGLVDHPITLSYADLEALPQISELGTLECVEG